MCGARTVGVIIAPTGGNYSVLTCRNGWWRGSARIGLILVMGCLCAGAGPAVADFSAGMTAYQRGDYRTAVNEWSPLAEAGDANAQEMLGFMHLYGQGFRKNHARALQWYRKAAEQGLASAENSLGVFYENGRETTKDYATAAEWYRRAARQNHAEAKNNLGRLNMEGRGVPTDYPEARRLFTAAAGVGINQAMINLGRMHESGLGTKTDLNEAAKWYIRAAQAGLTHRARARLVEVARHGASIAVDWLQDAANAGDPGSQRQLGLMYFDGVGTLQDYVRAHAWLNLAAALGNANAAADRNRLEEKMNGVELRDARDRAEAWWEANQGGR